MLRHWLRVECVDDCEIAGIRLLLYVHVVCFMVMGTWCVVGCGI